MSWKEEKRWILLVAVPLIILHIIMWSLIVNGAEADGDWKTHIIESREGYEEAMHWQEPTDIFINYTIHQKEGYTWWVLKHKEKMCLEWKVKNLIFDIQISKNVRTIPLDKMMEWKSITYDDFDIFEFKYKQCEEKLT